MRRTAYRLTAYIIAVLLLIETIACAGQDGHYEPSAETAESVQVTAPERGFPDYTKYPHLDAIAAYQKTDWQGEWIWTQTCQDDSYVAFRKTFRLEQAVSSAKAYIASVNQYCLWVNGELTVLDGCPRRGATPVDSYFDTVEINNLKEGENTIAVLVAFNGRSGDGSVVPTLVDEEGYESNQAGLLLDLYAGGLIVASDATWKAARHNAYRNRVTGGADYPRYEQASQLAERNVYYTAADSIGSFYEQDYDDSGWENAVPVSRAGELPFGNLYDGLIGAMAFEKPVDFPDAEQWISKTLQEDATLELSLPGNRQFTWLIELDAPEGKRLTVYTNTYEDRNGAKNFKDTYVTASSRQSYENYPWRSGSKLIIEAEAGVTFSRIAYRLSGYPSAPAGRFSSPDEKLNQLWTECLNTIAICSRDTFMDCPDRERGPYMGDAANEIDAALYGYDSQMLTLIKKTILSCIAWTTDTDVIPSRAPSVKPQEIANQSLAFSSAAYHYWQHTGDTETMRDYYRTFVTYLKLYEIGENGLPAFRNGSWTWNDWGTKIDTKLLQTGLYTYALRLTIQLAEELGIADDQAFLIDRMDSIRQNWRTVYSTPEGFRSKDFKFVDDRANAMLVLSGLAEESDYPQIAEVLTSTKEASPFMEKFVLEALCQMGYDNLALERIRERYAPMMEDEWDTIWELFNDETGTYNHAWSTGPVYILGKYIAGVRPAAPGWTAYEIAPSDALDAFVCSIETVRGTIQVELETTERGKQLTIHTIDADGTIVLPNSFGGRVSVSGGSYTLDGNRIMITESGTYRIETQTENN